MKGEGFLKKDSKLRKIFPDGRVPVIGFIKKVETSSGKTFRCIEVDVRRLNDKQYNELISEFAKLNGKSFEEMKRIVEKHGLFLREENFAYFRWDIDLRFLL